MNKVIQVYRKLQWLLIVVTFAVIVAVVFYQVFNRSIIKATVSWPEELARYLMVWLIYISSTAAFHKGSNVGMDFLTSRVKGKWKTLLDIFQCLCVVLFALLASYFSVGLVQMQLRLNQTSPALGIKMGYVYVAVTVWGVFTAVEAVAGTVNRIRERKKDGEEKSGR